METSTGTCDYPWNEEQKRMARYLQGPLSHSVAHALRLTAAAALPNDVHDHPARLYPARRTISLIQMGANGEVQFGGVG